MYRVSLVNRKFLCFNFILIDIDIEGNISFDLWTIWFKLNCLDAAGRDIMIYSLDNSI